MKHIPPVYTNEQPDIFIPGLAYNGTTQEEATQLSLDNPEEHELISIVVNGMEILYRDCATFEARETPVDEFDIRKMTAVHMVQCPFNNPLLLDIFAAAASVVLKYARVAVAPPDVRTCGLMVHLNMLTRVTSVSIFSPQGSFRIIFVMPESPAEQLTSAVVDTMSAVYGDNNGRPEALRDDSPSRRIFGESYATAKFLTSNNEAPEVMEPDETVH